MVHEGRYLTVRVDTIERRDGSRGQRDIVGHPGAVAMLALDEEDRVLLVRQWRTAAGTALLEVPAGTLDIHDGRTEDPDRAARRELEEETGYRARTWRRLTSFWTAPGFATEFMHLYLATDLEPANDDRLGPDEDERLDLHHLALTEALARVEDGTIRDAKSILALLWLDRARRSQAGASTAIGEAPSAPQPPQHATDLPASSSASVDLVYGFSPIRFALAYAALIRHRSRWNIPFGVLVVAIGVIGLLVGVSPLLSIGVVVLGFLAFSGAIVVPFAWWSMHRRRGILSEIRLHVDSAGLTSESGVGSGTVTWNAVERVYTGGGYVFVQTANNGLTLMIPQSAIGAAELARLERLLLEHGFLLSGARVDPPPARSLNSNQPR